MCNLEPKMVLFFMISHPLDPPISVINHRHKKHLLGALICFAAPLVLISGLRQNNPIRLLVYAMMPITLHKNNIHLGAIVGSSFQF